MGSSPIFRIQSVWTLYKNFIRFAEVSELADEQDSGSCERYAREGSSPFFRMRIPEGMRCFRVFLHFPGFWREVRNYQQHIPPKPRKVILMRVQQKAFQITGALAGNAELL